MLNFSSLPLPNGCEFHSDTVARVQLLENACRPRSVRVMFVNQGLFPSEYWYEVIRLKIPGITVAVPFGPEEALDLLSRESFQVVITDAYFFGAGTRLEIPRHLNENYPFTVCIVYSPWLHNEVRTHAVKLGVYRLIPWPAPIDEVISAITGALNYARQMRRQALHLPTWRKEDES